MARSEDAAAFMCAIREHVEKAIRDTLASHGVPDAAKTAQTEARAVSLALSSEWGGAQVYFPLKSEELNHVVSEEMANGATANDIAKKYRIAYSTVYKIYKEELASKREPKQATLPGV